MDQEIDVAIDEQDLTDIGEPTAEEVAAGVDWEAKAKEMTGIAKRRTTALRKAKENFGKIPKIEPKSAASNEPEKGKLDYGQKAYLNSLGFQDTEDQSYVETAMKETGKSLEDTLKSPFIKGELERMGEERKTKAAAAPANGRNGSPARDTVEYWINKGELPPTDQFELRKKVVIAKRAKAGGGNNFSSTPVVGSA